MGAGSMASGQTASAGSSAATGSVPTSGSSGSLASGATTTSGSGTAGGSPVGSGSSGSNASASGADGGALGGSGMDVSTPGLTDPGTEGDGDRTIGPSYTNAPETLVQAGVPKGTVISFMLPPGTIYPKAPTRNVRVYVPAQYVAGTPAPLMVVQDGMDSFYGFEPLLSATFDNLINAKMVPPVVLVFPDNGGGDNVGSERGLEYDTVSGLYAEWADTELLPAAEQATAQQLPKQAVTFTHDPQGRGTVGGSSGGAAAFSMAWWHPDLFTRVLTFSGTFVNQVPADSPFPHGCWVYHDVDPYSDAGPNGLIVQNCQVATGFVGASDPGPCDTPLSATSCQAAAGCAWNTSVNRPLRMWLEAGQNDDNAKDPPSTYRNFLLANQRMAAALEMRGYHYHYDYALGATHTDGRVMHQTAPEAMVWLWRGYPIGP
jgi:enterochelin esterase family protein